MDKKKKYYVVWAGASTGVFNSWGECEAAIKGFDGAKYKSFPTLEEAVEAFRGNPNDYFKKKAQTTVKHARKDIVWESISVDAACSGNPGDMEYRGVDTRTGQQIFHQGPFKLGTNNIGEFLAIVHALALLGKHGKHDTPIYTDSKTALAWVRKKKPNTQLVRNAKNEVLFELMDRASRWLENNAYRNPLLKWQTEDWGEIPADFGRK